MKEVLLNSVNLPITENERNFHLKIAESLNLKEGEAKKALESYDKMVNSSDAGIFDYLYNGEVQLFINDKDFQSNSLFCEYIYYYDYDEESFVMIDNHNETVTTMSLTDERWQKIFSMV